MERKITLLIALASVSNAHILQYAPAFGYVNNGLTGTYAYGRTAFDVLAPTAGATVYEQSAAVPAAAVPAIPALNYHAYAAGFYPYAPAAVSAPAILGTPTFGTYSPIAIPSASVAIPAAEVPAVVATEPAAEDDDTEVITPDANIPKPIGNVQIRRIFPVFGDSDLRSGALGTVKFVSPADLETPIGSTVITVKQETEALPTPVDESVSDLRFALPGGYPLAPAGIVQATQPRFVSVPFSNAKVSPILGSIVQEPVVTV